MADQSLVYEDPAVADGIHALIVGVSDYTYLPDADDPGVEESWFFNKLTSPALSAYGVYRWLDQNKANLRLPVKSIRLLLTASAVEKTNEPALQNLNAVVPTWTAFKDAAWAWRAAAGTRPGDMTFFYFAGHGLQRGPEEGILLMADFAEPKTAKMSRCVSFGEIRAGMAPTDSFPNIAQTQFYFIDACRLRPDTLKNFVNPTPAQIWEVELPRADRREAPVLFSTVDNTIAIGRDGKPSFFAEGLLVAFARGADDPDDSTAPPRWPITSLSMKTALDRFYLEKKVGTQVYPGGLVGAPILLYLSQPPDVDVGVTIRPDLLVGNSDVEIRDDGGQVVKTIAPCPSASVEVTIKVGIYRLLLNSQRIADSPYRSDSKSITPRTAVWPHDLTSRIAAG